MVYEASKKLKEDGIDVQVVSMPSWDRFEKQSTEYKSEVLPKAVTKRLAVEMASPFGWERYVGLDGTVLGIDQFGASAPGDVVIEKYGFTVENVVKSKRAYG